MTKQKQTLWSHIKLKHYDDGDYFKKGWHFRITWVFRGSHHFCIGYHEKNPIIAILKTKFIE